MVRPRPLHVDKSPCQVVLACVKPGPTLLDTLHYVQRKGRESDPDAATSREFDINDVLLIPNMNWDIDHRFTELEGPAHVFAGPGLQQGRYLDEARQRIRFQLDRSGVELRSRVSLPCLPIPRYFTFDRPFLLYLTQCGAATPFFVMWVGNSELLSPPR